MMKKIFSISTAVFCVLVIALLVTLACVKKNVPLETGTPYRIMVYNHSTSAYQSKTDKQAGFVKEDEEFSKLLNEINGMTNLSLFDWLLNENTLDLHPSQDLDGRFAKYGTEMKSQYVAVELWFANPNNDPNVTVQQDLVVWCNGSSKVVSFDRMIMIIPTDGNEYNTVVCYFSLDSQDAESQYKTCSPILFKARSEKLVKYIKSISN